MPKIKVNSKLSLTGADAEPRFVAAAQQARNKHIRSRYTRPFHDLKASVRKKRWRMRKQKETFDDFNLLALNPRPLDAYSTLKRGY